jgi:hypothetical protein
MNVAASRDVAIDPFATCSIASAISTQAEIARPAAAKRAFVVG